MNMRMIFSMLVVLVMSNLGSADGQTRLEITLDSDGEAALEMVGGPIRADASHVAIRIELDVLESLISEQQARTITMRRSEYYEETRGFKNPVVILKVLDESYRSHLTEFEIIPGAPFDVIVDLESPFQSLAVYLGGTQQRYKCFDASTCALKDEFTKHVWASRQPSVQYTQFDPVVTCENGSVDVEERIATPGDYRIRINKKEIYQHLDVSSDLRGNGSSNQFVGAQVTLGAFAYEKTPYRALHVFPMLDGLKLKLDVKAHYFCTYRSYSSSGYPFATTYAVKTQQSCPRAESGTNSSGTYFGSDHAYSKDWFVRDCKWN